MVVTNTTFATSCHEYGWDVENITNTAIFSDFQVKWFYFLDFDFFDGFSCFSSISFLISAALLSTACMIS